MSTIYSILTTLFTALFLAEVLEGPNKEGLKLQLTLNSMGFACTALPQRGSLRSKYSLH